MFQTVDSGPSFGSLLLQLFMAYCGPIAILIAFHVWLHAPETPASQILDYVFLAAAGIALALFVTALTGNSTKLGIFVWVLPAAIELYAAISESLSFGIASLGSTLLYGQGEDGWVVMVLTLPTWSCCWYSAATWWRRRTKDREVASSIPLGNAENRSA